MNLYVSVALRLPAPSRDLRAERLNRGLSQEAIAAQVGVTRRVWARAESGRGVAPRHAVKIASFLGLSVTELWPQDGKAAG